MLSENPPLWRREIAAAAAPSVCVSLRAYFALSSLFARQFILVFQTDRTRSYTNAPAAEERIVHIDTESSSHRDQVGRRVGERAQFHRQTLQLEEIVCVVSIRILSCDANYTQHKTELTLPAASKLREWREMVGRIKILRKVPLWAKHDLKFGQFW